VKHEYFIFITKTTKKIFPFGTKQQVLV